MKNYSSYILVLIILSVFAGCMITSHSDNYQQLLDKKLTGEELGKVKFLYGDMGGIYPHTLKTNAFVFKISVLALTVIDSNKQDKSTQSLFKKYGFSYSEKIRDFPNAPIDDKKPIGLLSGKISGIHPIKGKYFIETADFGCGICHGGPVYGPDGNLSNEYALGMPNTSLNLSGFGNDLFAGYKVITKWDESIFIKRITELYPGISKQELNGLKIYFTGLKKEVAKIAETRETVSTYKIGGPGLMNGIGAIKHGLGMLDKTIYHENEVALVSIPSLVQRSFRSSFLVSGNYAPKNKDFFYVITDKDTSSKHDEELSAIIALFTIGTMGYNAKMAERALPEVKDVMNFISKAESPGFPGVIDIEKAEKGRKIFQGNCESCHGIYNGSPTRNKIVSFPNRLIPYESIKTDSVRAVAITSENLKVLEKLPLRKYFNARVNKGYVAPILSGLWATAPYLHNGSVPTLWHLMHPDARPEKFYYGGHRLDYDKMGINGIMKDGVYKYPEDYVPFSAYEIYNTKEKGLSNSGHSEPFNYLTENEKTQLLEFLKTL